MAQEKKTVLGAASPKSLGEAFRCGACLHFRQHAHKHKDTVCAEIGVKQYAIAPRCFTPDVTKIAPNAQLLAQLTALINSYTPQQRHILLGVLRNNRKRRISFGQKVYFRAIGKDYISNYLSGYCLGYSSAGDLIVAGSPDVKTAGRMYTAYLHEDSVMLPQAWRAKREDLIRKGRVNDPDKPLSKKKVVETHEPPTMDAAPSAWFTKTDIDVKKKRGSYAELSGVITL